MATLSVEEAMTRVKRGMHFLDDHRSPDWREEIEMDRLDISSGHACVLGQLYDSYSEGVVELGLADDDDVSPLNLGFLAEYENSEVLTRAWQLALVLNGEMSPSALKLDPQADYKEYLG